MTYARLALACGEPSLARLLRSVTARDLAFWRAFEAVDGPIGCGPLVRVAAWLGWTQCDVRQVSPADVLETIQGFLAADPAGEEAAEPAAAEPAADLEQKVIRIFQHPEFHRGDD